MTNSKTPAKTQSTTDLKKLKTLVSATSESLLDEVHALRTISMLLCAANSSASINISQLSCLIDPIVERQTNLINDMRFY